MKTSVRIFAIALAVAFASLDVSMEGNDLATVTISASTPAQAEIGRPLTPLSYAGAARRTTRRVVRRTTVYVNTLPAGCVYGPYYGGYYYRCGSLYYAKSGATYVQVVIE
ncbi:MULTISPECIES: hypothetical protein [unclassified Rhizobium]|uniref:hypothetical protein n=1 Tax=unclassified Rhizobium TaxID=2613769 RepID=UPI002168E8D9|nr:MULTISPECIES: hypothetical protein [unclassified Rhizobium]MCS3741527.1 hypothetical protein [Rhizobium sp. BK661]MCS4092863.1 hypothetical protein [Rhizobium sp. BK176]